MNKPWHFHDEVLDEIARTIGWYESQREGLGEDFVFVLDEVLARLEAAPDVARPAPEDERACRVLLPRFPYAVVFVELDDHYLVVAVAHLKRRPGYWLTRVAGK